MHSHETRRKMSLAKIGTKRPDVAERNRTNPPRKGMKTPRLVEYNRRRAAARWAEILEMEVPR